MSKEYIEHVDPPKNDEGWIEYALQLLWSETGYEHASDKAALETSELRETIAALTERVGRLELQIKGLLEFYNQNDDESSACYWVDKNYSLVSENDEKREWFLTAKQIQARRAQIELEAQ
jgi:hypothetical protein